jgi:glyceraldehyde 3-phosphate dehydrogenase
MAVKVGINGFGRIGRNVLRAALGNPEIDFVAVNDLTSPATLAHLLKYDSILGNLKNEITAGDDFITVDGKKIKVWAERDPAKLALGRSRRADRHRIHRPLYRRRQGQGPPRLDR